MIHIKVSQFADPQLDGFVYALCGIKTTDYDHKDEDYYYVPACIDTNCHKNPPTCPRCLAVYRAIGNAFKEDPL